MSETLPHNCLVLGDVYANFWTPTNQLRWLEYQSNVDPRTGEGFAMPGTYTKLQQAWHSQGVIEWRDVPTVTETLQEKTNV